MLGAWYIASEALETSNHCLNEILNPYHITCPSLNDARIKSKSQSLQLLTVKPHNQDALNHLPKSQPSRRLDSKTLSITKIGTCLTVITTQLAMNNFQYLSPIKIMTSFYTIIVLAVYQIHNQQAQNYIPSSLPMKIHRLNRRKIISKLTSRASTDTDPTHPHVDPISGWRIALYLLPWVWKLITHFVLYHSPNIINIIHPEIQHECFNTKPTIRG